MSQLSFDIRFHREEMGGKSSSKAMKIEGGSISEIVNFAKFENLKFAK